MEQFTDTQLDYLISIRKSYGPINNGNTDLFKTCKCFLSVQRQQLEFLERKRRIHMLEKGRVNFRLVAEEQVTLSYLKQIFTDFAKPLDGFIQHVTELIKRSNPSSASVLNALKQEAMGIARDMLKISLVLESQPESTNYDKNKNPVPDILCLGAQCFSDFSTEECQVTVVSESKLFEASKDNKPLEKVEGFKGVAVKTEATKQAKSSRSISSNQRKDAIVTNLGFWSIPKDQLLPSDKGSAHKDWVRLKFTMKVRHEDINQDLWLLSLPFNIRKGSIQMYTFIGALMWYFYITPDPYKVFTVQARLPISTVLNMLITRLEVIGRKLSPVAKTFLADRLEKISHREEVELETVTRGPPSTKKDQESEETPSVDEAIELFGFFSWFYALAKSLDTSGYLHNLWLDGTIYDICEVEHLKEMIAKNTFGTQVVVIRPSMSNIYKHQGKDINMGLAFFFKTPKQPEKVITINLLMENIIKCGLYNCLTFRLPLEFIYMKDGKYKSISDLKPLTAVRSGKEPKEKKPGVKSYHGTDFNMAGGPELAGSDAISKHCSTCHCHNAEVNSMPSGESESKKARNPSGNSDVITSTSDWQNENRIHKSVTSSPSTMTPSSQFDSLDYNVQDSPDSGNESQMSPSENRIPDFDRILLSSNVPAQGRDTISMNQTDVPSLSKREQLLANFQCAFNYVSSLCSDEVIEQLTKDMMDFASSSSPSAMAVLPGCNVDKAHSDLPCPPMYDLNPAKVEFVPISMPNIESNTNDMKCADSSTSGFMSLQELQPSIECSPNMNGWPDNVDFIPVGTRYDDNTTPNSIHNNNSNFNNKSKMMISQDSSSNQPDGQLMELLSSAEDMNLIFQGLNMIPVQQVE